jgi:glycine betaine/proline transport system ATP-binding protein
MSVRDNQSHDGAPEAARITARWDMSQADSRPGTGAPPLIEARSVSRVFGPRERDAIAMLRDGADRGTILARTGTVIALNQVSFNVARGEILVVMGLSGSGKSTLLRCLNRLIEPSSGSVHVGGRDVTRMGAGELRQFRRASFGMVFQHFALFPHRTVLENVEYGLEVQGASRAARREAAMGAIELVGLGGWEGKRPGQLSGGMKQRAGLARALAANADVLLMDEAFSALDPLIRRDMQQELVALQERLRKTIVFVSHDLDEAIALGGRIVLMKDGAIVQAGTAEQILAAPATPYVERFVEHIDASGVLTAATLLDRGAPALRGSDSAAIGLGLLRDLGAAALPVLGPDGRLLGRAGQAALEREVALAGTVGNAAAPCASLGAAMTLREALPVLAAEPDGVPVVDAAGQFLGTLGRAAALAGLARARGPAPGPVPGPVPGPASGPAPTMEETPWTGPFPASRSTDGATAASTGSPRTAPASPVS